MLLNWSSLIFTGIVNFLVPFILYYKARSDAEKAKHNLLIHNINTETPEIDESDSEPDLDGSRSSTQDSEDCTPGTDETAPKSKSLIGKVWTYVKEAEMGPKIPPKKSKEINLAYPIWMDKHWRIWTIICGSAVLVLLGLGIGVNLYFLIFLHKNLLGWWWNMFSL